MKKTDPIEIVPYNPNWPTIFETEATKIKQALGNNCIAIHHVGSTSVPGLAAKPIIDIVPVVRDILALDQNTSEMEALGYEAKGEYGMLFRRYFQKKGFNVHIFEQSSAEIDGHLLFRNWMQGHADDREHYAKLKQDLALLYPNDIYQYVIGKDAFVKTIHSKTGFNGLRVVKALTPREWAFAKHFRDTYFFGRHGIDDPYSWTFDHSEHTHLILYQGTEIIGYAHIQFWSDRRATIRIIAIDEGICCKNTGSTFLVLIKKWLKSLGVKSIHAESRAMIWTHRINERLERKYPTKPEQSELGQVSLTDIDYNPDRLFTIPRMAKRKELGIQNHLPFFGFDCWNHYEVSWLNEKGRPCVAIAEIIYDCETPYLIESKSLKLYFNSFNNTKFKNIDEVRQTVACDLSKRLEGDVQVRILSLREAELTKTQTTMIGECIDDLDVTCDVYLVEPTYLLVEENRVEEKLYSDLLKSNCLVTNQPDWGSVHIAYKGRQINREGLLKYLVSFRNHNEFHEQCIERIFVDIMNYCNPERLTVYGRYTRRGGLDINPYRSTEKIQSQNLNQRLVRQ